MIAKSYEIQLFESGTWKIQAIFEEEERALSEAHRMAESGKCGGIRVVEEAFSFDANESRIRTIFNNARVGKTNAELISERLKIREKTNANQEMRDGRIRKYKFKKKVRQRRTQSRMGLLVLLALIAIGSAAWIGLQRLETVLQSIP